ncbi:hypothetical protein C3Z23_06530 [Salmonella enterica]|nr:hypothetical protein [Salmonella enterica]
MGIIAGIKLFTSVISYKYPALTIFIRCLQGTIDTQDILFLLYSLSSGSPFMLLLLPLCNITGHAIRSAKSRHRPVMTDDIPMWSRSDTATPR